jgi:hypothetical protein
MRRSKGWIPDAADLETLTEHLFYEVQMTFFLAGQLDAPTGSRIDVSARNAQIEAFTFHLRQLGEFFWGDPPRNRVDRVAFAADYFPDGNWERLRPELPAIIAKSVAAPDGARLTYDRTWIRPADLLWDVVTQAFALAPVVIRFTDAVDHSQFAPGYLHGIRLCAEMYVGGSRPSDADLAA